MRARPLLVTGGAGFIGANLADALASRGHGVHVLDSLARPGVEANLDWLRSRHPRLLTATIADVRDGDALAAAAGEAAGVFHLAAQVAVTTSLVAPRHDFEVNLGGTINLLDALRQHNPAAPLIFASTNKVYGDLSDLALERAPAGWQPVDPAIRRHGVAERRSLDFHTPYGCSKGAADQYVLDHARSFGLRAAVLRMSCVYGERQLGTEDQGWVAHFLIRALEGRPVTLYGDGRQVRDILDVGDAVAAWIGAWEAIDRVRGRAFNLGGGPDNAVSLRRLLGAIEVIIGQKVAIEEAGWRAGDQRWFVADTRAARAALKLPPPRHWSVGVPALAHWLAGERGLDLAPERSRVVAA